MAMLMSEWVSALCLVAMVIPVLHVQGLEITSDGCDSTKGCFRHPSECTGAANCDFFASWVMDMANHSNLIFQISGKGTGYVALGFSKSGSMRDSDVYACTSNGEVVRSRNTVLNENYPNQPLKGVSGVSVSVVNDRIECEFTRQATLNDNDETYYDLTENNTYHVIMAKANDIKDDGNINYHFGGKEASPMQVSSFLEYAATTQDGGVTSDGCDATKGCFRFPDGCSVATTCNFFLSWTKDANNNHIFAMSGKAETYVALGFSKSGKMRESDVYACTKNNEIVRSQNTVFNVNDPNQPLKGVSDETVSVVDGRVECKFTRQASLSDGDDTYYDLSGKNKYFIIMARSSGDLKADGNINIHDKKVQGGKTSFNEFTGVGVRADNKLKLRQAHGSLMIIAWVGLASIGITIARFFKPIWPDSKICGKPMWFAFHRVCMVLAFSCTITAFIVIFISVEGFLDLGEDLSGLLRFLHAVLGTVVTGLAVLNPIMAMFRPHPGEPRRPIFNWAHWAVGTSAHIIGMATICLGLGYRSARSLISGLPGYLFWVIIGFIAFHFIAWLLFQIKKCSIVNKTKEASNDIPLQDKSQDSQQQLVDNSKPSSKDTGIMSTMLVIYVFVVLGVVATIVVNIILVVP